METDEAVIISWFTGRLPQEWFSGQHEFVLDREEIAVIGSLQVPDAPEDMSSAERAALLDGLIQRFRKRRASAASRSPARPSTGSAARSPGAFRWTARQ